MRFLKTGLELPHVTLFSDRIKQDQSHVTYGDRKQPIKNHTGNHFGTVENCDLLL